MNRAEAHLGCDWEVREDSGGLYAYCPGHRVTVCRVLPGSPYQVGAIIPAYRPMP